MFRAYLLFSLTALFVFSITHSSAQNSRFHEYDSLFHEVILVDFDKAASYLEQQKKAYKTKSDKADYWLNSMMLNYKLNEFSAAREDGSVAQKYFSKKDEARYGTYLKLESLIDWKEGNFTRANQRLLNAMDKGELKEPIARAHLYNIVLSNFISAEDYDSALMMANRVDAELERNVSLKETRSGKYKRLLQTNLLSKGSIHYYISAYDSALYYYQQAHELDPDDPVWSINCQMSIADVLTLKGDYDKASDYYVDILKKLEAQSPGINLAHAYHNYAVNFNEQEDFSNARRYFRKAEQLSAQLNYNLILGFSLQAIGEGFFDQGELDSAKVYMERSIPVLEKIQNARGLCMAHCRLARVLAKNGKQKESFQSVNEAKKWMEQVNTLEVRSEVWTAFYEYYDRYGPANLALDYLKLSAEAKDSIEGVEMQKNLNTLIVKYETELKEKENQVLRVDISRKNVEIERKEEARKFWQGLIFFMVVLLILIVVLGVILLKMRRQKLEAKERKLVHADQIRTLLLRKLDAADQAVKDAEQVISELKHTQEEIEASKKQNPEQLIESMRTKKDWAAFMVEFELIYTHFFSELKKISSGDFTNSERRMLALIKLGLTNQEIADQVFISRDSVKKSKSRLFKKVSIPDSKIKPADFIRNIE
ncbi:MAG: LuxR C-terminal-related transcriptional regulator [Crocinitomicaceae bacterium]